MKTYHALVVDDSSDILEDVRDRLESLGHTCDCASTQEQAREVLQSGTGYSYVLLDLEIPVKYGRKSRVQNGRNLLAEIRATPGLENVPIIVMTSHGKDGPQLAIDVMRHNGADDYITKPFEANGRTMEQTIEEALSRSGRSRPGASRRSAAAKPGQPPQPFEEGELVFYDTHVELCGVKLCGDGDGGIIRPVLDLLRERRPNGKRAFYSGDQLACRLDLDRGQNAIAEAVRDFRNQAARLLLAEANVQIDRTRDLILNDRRYGYRLSAKLAVVDGHGHARGGESGAKVDASGGCDAPPRGMSGGGAEMDPGQRREWIQDQLRQGRKLQKKHITAALQCSSSTADRDLKRLRDAGRISFVGAPKTGHWQLVAG